MFDSSWTHSHNAVCSESFKPLLTMCSKHLHLIYTFGFQSIETDNIFCKRAWDLSRTIKDISRFVGHLSEAWWSWIVKVSFWRASYAVLSLHPEPCGPCVKDERKRLGFASHIKSCIDLDIEKVSQLYFDTGAVRLKQTESMWYKAVDWLDRFDFNRKLVPKLCISYCTEKKAD